LFLSDAAQGMLTLEGKTARRVLASVVRRPGVEGPFAPNIMLFRQPERSQRFLFDVTSNHGGASRRTRSEEESSVDDPGKSDGRIVPLQRVNQARESNSGNAEGGKAAKLPRESDRTSPALSGGTAMHHRLARISARAERLPEERFNNLYSLLDVELLRQAFQQLERGKASGVDSMTVEQYEADLERNLRDLADRLQRQSYRPRPSLRKLIPKGDGKTRPLGIACVEDKLVQRALVMILEPIYERDFLPCSFGFRPGKSCHDALGLLGQYVATTNVNWVSDSDIKGFFDHVDHARLLELLGLRIADPRLLRLITRFLKAGVMIEGRREETEEGVPQGSVLSPLLANVYLHYVLDRWFARDVQPRLGGAACLVRYADDFIVGFERERDAQRFQEVLRKRLAKYSLQLAEEKTKLVRFGRFAERDCARRNDGSRPGTFDFLGFTHYGGHSRTGKFKLKRKTATKKLRAKFRTLKEWFRQNLTTPIDEVWGQLNSKLRGHYQYYGVNDNWPWLVKFREAARRFAYRWICRRSQKGRLSHRAYQQYLVHNPLAAPQRLTDLIARGRQLAAAVGAVGVR
jgi:RNA-directed DNA polymerase